MLNHRTTTADSFLDEIESPPRTQYEWYMSYLDRALIREGSISITRRWTRSLGNRFTILIASRGSEGARIVGTIGIYDTVIEALEEAARANAIAEKLALRDPRIGVSGEVGKPLLVYAVFNAQGERVIPISMEETAAMPTTSE